MYYYYCNCCSCRLYC